MTVIPSMFADDTLKEHAEIMLSPGAWCVIRHGENFNSQGLTGPFSWRFQCRKFMGFAYSGHRPDERILMAQFDIASDPDHTYSADYLRASSIVFSGERDQAYNLAAALSEYDIMCQRGYARIMEHATGGEMVEKLSNLRGAINSYSTAR